MSNLRSDALHFASTMTIDSPCSTYITRLCCQIDEVEERWHKAERDLAAANARIERLRDECKKSRAWSRRGACRDAVDDMRTGSLLYEMMDARREVDANNDLGEPPATAKETPTNG